MRVSLMAMAFLLLSCSHSSSDSNQDPLKNSKKLIKEGHVSLYQNGSFNVPGTTVMLIPPGPNTLDLASELAGTSAKAAFHLSVKRAKESVTVIKRGSAWSLRQGKNVSQFSSELSNALRQFGRENSKVILDRSFALSHKVVGGTWDEAKNQRKALSNWADGKEIEFDSNIELSDEFFDQQLEYSREANRRLQEEWKNSQKIRAKKYSATSYRHFVLGNLATPKVLTKNWNEFIDSPTFEQFVKDHRDAEEWRQENSDKYKSMMMDAHQSYGSRIYTQILKGNKELTEMSDEYGFSLASVKALKYYLQGLLVEGVMKPIGKLSGGALGYLAVNSLAYPAILVAKDGVTSMELAVEVVGLGMKSGYAITAPTVGAAAAGTLSLFHRGNSALAPTVIYLGAKAEEAGLVALKYGTKGSLKLSSAVMTHGTTYVAVPLTTAGITATGVISSAVFGGSGLATSGATLATGEVTSAVTTIAGQSAAASTVVIGTAVSVGTGAAVMLYDVGKAMTVPPAYALGGGIVLSYGTMVHLSSQTLLAVADASYLVLSLEGPKWVLYAVKGNLMKDEDISSGTVMDLNKMQKKGEVFYQVPATDEEVKAVVKDLGKDLGE